MEKTRKGVWLEQPPEFDGWEAEIVRQQCGMTQVQMAEQMGCSERTVRLWERGGRNYHFQNRLHREKLEQLMSAGAAARRERGEF